MARQNAPLPGNRIDAGLTKMQDLTQRRKSAEFNKKNRIVRIGLGCRIGHIYLSFLILPPKAILPILFFSFAPLNILKV